MILQSDIDGLQSDITKHDPTYYSNVRSYYKFSFTKGNHIKYIIFEVFDFVMLKNYIKNIIFKI